uniref:Small nuclear ribonucleoprotein n=1 Tax=uncultured marine crenarchaeote E37-7F TaxID=907717 RepID=G9BAN9_9ARCH|nr:small nuclear ribonucleoprotein [uncultured marine crenarchaeote E37-7F]
MMANVGRRMFFDELSKLLQKTVIAITVDGKTYTGNLEGYDPESMSICLTNAKDEEGKTIPKIFFIGNTISKIYATEKPFDLQALANRLERIFPRMVKLYDDIDVIVVMDRVRINASGLLEGSGPIAERAVRVYNEFIKDESKAENP